MKKTGIRLSASAPTTSLVRMREPDAVAAALHPELDDDAHQHEAERHHQQKNQEGNAEEDERLLRVVRRKKAETSRERTLPDHQRAEATSRIAPKIYRRRLGVVNNRFQYSGQKNGPPAIPEARESLQIDTRS